MLPTYTDFYEMLYRREMEELLKLLINVREIKKAAEKNLVIKKENSIKLQKILFCMKIYLRMTSVEYVVYRTST